MIRIFWIWIGLAALLCCDSVRAGASETSNAFVVEPITIGLPIDLPLADGVRDPIFSILIGLVEGNIYGTLSQARLQSEVEDQGRSSKVPYERILEVTRLPRSEERTTGEVEVRFDGDLKIPIPYSILGYNPGSLRASPVCRFQEWDLGDLVLTRPAKKGDERTNQPIELKDAHLFGVIEGELLLDIDGWLDKMLGGKLDDTEITALLLCRYEDDWHGFAMGYNADRKGRSGALNFRRDKVVFPSPSEIKTIGRSMRSRAEQLMAGR